MNVFNFKKSSAIKSIILISTVLVFSNVHAQPGSGNHDGGLMKQMTLAKYQPKVITDPEAQARLRLVVIPETGHQNGGLMKQMTLAKYQPKVITDPEAQARLRQVVIPETGHQNGGLMKQMRDQLMKADAR
jgi:septum formation topological specificity factor MinE